MIFLILVVNIRKTHTHTKYSRSHLHNSTEHKNYSTHPYIFIVNMTSIRSNYPLHVVHHLRTETDTKSVSVVERNERQLDNYTKQNYEAFQRLDDVLNCLAQSQANPSQSQPEKSASQSESRIASHKITNNFRIRRQHRKRQ